jgi:transcriptional regulator of acetoin/glycerol metabolism
VTLRETLDDAAREAIRAALVAHSGNVRRTAVALDISRATLDREIVRLGLREWLTDEYERAARQPQR